MHLGTCRQQQAFELGHIVIAVVVTLETRLLLLLCGSWCAATARLNCFVNCAECKSGHFHSSKQMSLLPIRLGQQSTQNCPLLL
jgi:hypothetical protein